MNESFLVTTNLIERQSPGKLTLKHNGALVWAGSVGGVSPPVTRPCSLVTKLSRRDSRHGTAFAKLVCGTAFGFRGLGLTDSYYLIFRIFLWQHNLSRWRQMP